MNKMELIETLKKKVCGNRMLAEWTCFKPEEVAYFRGNAYAYEKVIEMLEECE